MRGVNVWMMFAASPPRSLRLVLYAAACLIWLALLAWLASVSWFLTDDAFISFRYARNLLDGHGLVFNAGERVEGYTNFLWVLELAAIWGALGIRPEHAAPWLSVAFTAGTLAAMLWWAARMPGLRHRGLAAWMALGLVCGSATFAVWTSGGGLETRQFTFFVLCAVVCLSLYRNNRWGLLAASLSLALAALTRPEGVLIAVVCLGWFAVQRLVDGGRLRFERGYLRELLTLAAPFAILVAAHFLFRYAYYGEWLPNTYYAKFVRPWWDMGFYYYAVAALETGLYLLGPLALVGAWVRWRNGRDGVYAPALLCIGVHALSVMRLGGDHFEWRPLDFYWPLLALPAVEGILRLGSLGGRIAGKARALQVGMRARVFRSTQAWALLLFVPVMFYASAMQAALLFESKRSGYSNVGLNEQNADWLLWAPGMERISDLAGSGRWRIGGNYVGARLGLNQQSTEGVIESWAPYDGAASRLIPHDAVASAGRIGIMPYYISNLTVVDACGLVDKVVARNPVIVPNKARLMAHDRNPPIGYLERRGVNFIPHPAATSETEALFFAPYAVPFGSNLWLPFYTDEPIEWVEERFTKFSHDARRWMLNTVPAVILSEGVPEVGEPFTVALSEATRKAGFTQRGRWQWQRGSDAEGWIQAFGIVCPGYQYIPTTDDIGLRLRAHVTYTDAAGNKVRAITPASEPVAAR